MRERLLTLLFALGALLLFYVMFVHSGTAPGPNAEVARPLTTERRGNGYFAAMEWLARAGVPVRSFRSRFTGLEAATAHSPSGNLMVVTLPAVTGFRTEELLPLDRWIRRGNTLLVVAALEDRPDWAFASAGVSASDLKVLSGLDFEPEPAPALTANDGHGVVDRAAGFAQAFATPQRSTLVPNAAFTGSAMLRGVRAVSALSDYPARSWAVRVPYDGFVLALARLAASDRAVLWERPFGAGRILVSGFGSVFTNRAIGADDNARLLANLVGAAVSPGGAVLFDDFRQGLAAVYDPARFYRDHRLHLTVGVLIGLWLAWVLGSTRLRVPRPPRAAPPRETEFLQAAGGFLARVLRSDAAALRLYDLFARRLCERLGRPAPGGVPWDWLERHPRLAPADLALLRRWYARAQSARRVPLVRLQNLLLAVDRQLA